MSHPLVDQLRFTRMEFVRCLAGVDPNDAVRRIPPLNCLSWIIGHMASQESAFWILWAQSEKLHPELRDIVGTGRPASTPPLAEMWACWHEITTTADRYLDTLTSSSLQNHFIWKGERLQETVGTLLQRNIYHYWFHTGEAHAIRQVLGHTSLPQFVGNLGEIAPYRLEEP
jgi:hypothetical protein